MNPMTKNILNEEIPETITEVILTRGIHTMDTTKAIPEGIIEVIQTRTSRNR